MNAKSEHLTLSPEGILGMPLTGIRLIEASAGTGKTWTIGNLYLRHILEGRRVSEVLLVTFTNAATDELRGRVRARLHEAQCRFRAGEAPGDPFLQRLLEERRRDANLEQDIERLRLAVRSMDEAAIHTIHGFCQQALGDHAFNSGQPFEVELDSDDDDLWENAIKDWWRRTAYPLSPGDFTLFRRSLGTLGEFMELQRPLRHAHDRTLVPVPESGTGELFERWRGLETGLLGLATAWRQRRDELVSILRDSKALSRNRKLPFHSDRLPGAIGEMDTWAAAEDLLDLPELLPFLSARALLEHSKQKQRGQDPQLEDAFFLDCQHILEQMQSVQDGFRVAALGEATGWCAVQVERVKQQRHSLAFHDLLVRLHAALNDTHQGPALAGNLRRRFPVAMIDEFQDTDAIQYGIFRILYHDQPGTALIMIGDPKQAIYSFRGGDIFTYMRAREDAGDERYTLATNWRSVPALVEAVNCLFSRRSDAFVYSEAIDYAPVTAASETQRGKPHELLRESGRAVSPLTLWRIPEDDGKPLNKGQAIARVVAATTEEIARLIAGGAQGNITLGHRALQAGDIAVLVRTGYEGQVLRAALQERGIQAVSVGHDKVWQSPEARDLLALLQAVISCNDRSLARTALASGLLELDYAGIAERLQDEHRWLDWVDRLRALNRLWQGKGFMAMFQAMLHAFGIGERLAGGLSAERRLTNLLHLGELLQQASKQHPGLDALLGWYRRQLHEGAGEEAELRMESDEQLVRIVTIHSSKGLEYPVVFAPFLWGCRAPAGGKRLVSYHDAEKRAFFDALARPGSASLYLAEKERLAEDVRLAYVALTRARARLYLCWGPVQQAGRNRCSSGSTALAWLLHPVQTPDDIETAFPDAFAQAPAIDDDLAALARASAGGIDVRPLPAATAGTRIAATEAAGPELVPATFTGHVASDWRIASFSGLTRDIHQTPHGGSPRSGRDPVLDFPAGSRTGLFLHLLLEKLDFQADVGQQALQMADELGPRFGFDPAQVRETIAGWIRNVVETPLDHDDLRLSTLSCERRLNELEFDFSIDRVDIGALNRVLDDAAGEPLEAVGADDFRGMITGIIDLVFEHGGRFYIADYKSNFLGGSLADYAPARLRHAMLDRRYDLQYLLYTLALHRYLRQRLEGYRYRDHLGGVYYLFLRGMRPEHGPAFGVFHDLPDETLIQRLDDELLRPETGAVS